MRTEAQREASRINGARGRGPKTPEGKEAVKFNGLKHGLRAEEVVLPGEDPAAFEAERQAWLADWSPRSHTRSVLVEMAAVASWRFRRAVRSETACRAGRAERAARDFDRERLARVDRAMDRFDDDPRAALSLLEIDAAGIDRLLASWGELAQALERGPGGWDRPLYHSRLMLLHGRRADADPDLVGPAALASARLIAALDGKRMPKAEAEEAAEALRAAVAEAIERLRALRARALDPETLRRWAVEAAHAEASGEDQLRHRYEMAIERSLRSTIKQLLDLDRSGADLPEPAEPEPLPDTPVVPEPEPTPPDPAPAGPAPPASESTAPGSVGARGLGSDPTPGAAPDGAPRPPARAKSEPVGPVWTQ